MILKEFKKTDEVIESLLVILKSEELNQSSFKILTEDLLSLKFKWKDFR